MRRLSLVLLGAIAQRGDSARMSLHKAAEEAQIEPLKVAIQGRFDAVNDRWKKPDVDAPNAKGQVPLHLAVCNKRSDVEAVRVLLENGAADPNVRDRRDLTPLHLVAQMCGHTEAWQQSQFARIAIKCAKLLLKHAADVNATATDERVTPLHMAASGGHDKLVELYIARRADINAADSSGATPLHHAARALSARVVLRLIKAGADTLIADAAGVLPREAVGAARDSQSVRIREHFDSAAELRAEAIEERKKAKAERAAARAKAEL